VVGQEQQAEPDLGDEEGLGERQQMGDDAARLAPAQVGEPADKGRRPRHPQYEECDRVVRRYHRSTMIAEGQEAPYFELTSDAGETVSLSALRAKPVVLYVYPKDDTLGS